MAEDFFKRFDDEMLRRCRAAVAVEEAAAPAAASATAPGAAAAQGKPSAGMPMWAWVVIGVLVVAGGAWLLR
jgi:hypothetical protein